MKYLIIALLLVVSYSFSNSWEYFYIHGKPYILQSNAGPTDSMKSGELPERYDVLGGYVYKHYKKDTPRRFREKINEVTLLSIKNDSLFIDSIRFSSVEAAVEMDVPLSKIFPDAKEKIFASWFSDTLHLTNNICYEWKIGGKVDPYETDYIIVMEKGLVVKTGIAAFHCEEPLFYKNSTYKELENFDSEDRNNPCR
ncbi:MAG: hypothetical protein HUK20_02070, partial [Fibrobacter sp.]|nr:hypothetical protein [Fibrobacter sp.]